MVDGSSFWCDDKNINYDVIKWKHFPRNWPFLRGIHRSPVNSPHKGQWRGALMFSLICVWMNDWVNNREAGDLRRHLDHYDVSVMHMGHDTMVYVLCFITPCFALNINRADSRLAPGQWETSLQSNTIGWAQFIVQRIIFRWIFNSFRELVPYVCWTEFGVYKCLRMVPKMMIIQNKTCSFHSFCEEISMNVLVPLLLTWINFSSSMDKWSYPS